LAGAFADAFADLWRFGAGFHLGAVLVATAATKLTAATTRRSDGIGAP
jgi:hypothetical protein